MNRPDKLYQDLFKKFVRAHGSSKSKQSCQVELADIWKTEIKVSKTIDEAKYTAMMRNLDEIIVRKEKKGSIVSFFKKSSSLKTKDLIGPIINDDHTTEEVKEVENEIAPEQFNTLDDREPAPTPAQDKMNTQLAEMERALLGLLEARDIGLEGETAVALVTKIKETKV